MGFVVFMTFLLLTPVIICNSIDDSSWRIVVIVISTIAIQTVLSSLTKWKTIELFLAGAT